VRGVFLTMARFRSNRRPRQPPTELSSEAHTLLGIMAQLEKVGMVPTTAALSELRGTRNGPTNRMLKKLAKRGFVELMLDPVSNKAGREWRTKPSPT